MAEDDEQNMELVLDISQDNRANVEFAPQGVGVTVKMVPGQDCDQRMVIVSGVSVADVERLLMSALSALEINWQDGSFEEAGEDPATRDPRLQNRTWLPWAVG
ncbi:hypothetical protein SEA_DALANDE_14 [Gordonia phage DalanDe]|nr:hypothetical protein SEA_DALANDE_14 [Gordonia phage DalanDe]